MSDCNPKKNTLLQIVCMFLEHDQIRPDSDNVILQLHVAEAICHQVLTQVPVSKKDTREWLNALHIIPSFSLLTLLIRLLLCPQEQELVPWVVISNHSYDKLDGLWRVRTNALMAQVYTRLWWTGLRGFFYRDILGFRKIVGGLV